VKGVWVEEWPDRGYYRAPRHTEENDRGRKKMLTKVRSFTFSPSRVDALLSITALALNSLRDESANTLRPHDRWAGKDVEWTYSIPKSDGSR
jgi:hypothetical protein